MSEFIQSIEFKLEGSLFDKINALPEDTKDGVRFYDYKLNGVTTGSGSQAARMDFQTTLQMASLQRARRVEEQVNPLANIITERNDQLEELGKGLAAAGSIEAQLPGDADPNYKLTVDGDHKLTSANVANGEELIRVMNKYCGKHWKNNTWVRSELKEANQMLKTEIDRLNADSQSDMTRLQGLMDKRDQGFTLASDLITKDCDNISAIIRNVTP